MTNNKIEEKTFFSLLPRINSLLIIVQVVVLFWRKSILPTVIPLFYSRPWGEEQLANKNWLFLLPAISLVILCFSFFFDRLLVKKGESFLVIVNAGFSLLFSLLATVTLLKIIFLIT